VLSKDIKELGSASNDEPWFFLKPTTSYLRNGGTILIPKGVTTHHEIELGVVIGKEGKDIPRDKWEERTKLLFFQIIITSSPFCS
jgi:acylpyruvate hydrolase